MFSGVVYHMHMYSTRIPSGFGSIRFGRPEMAQVVISSMLSSASIAA